MGEAAERVRGFGLDPAALNAALFEAYKGSCDCPVCEILREAVGKTVQTYLPKKRK